MTRGRRAALLIGLALIMGALAASDMGGREKALKRSLQPVVEVVVASKDIRAGDRIAVTALSTRRVPSRYAPSVAIDDPQAVAGVRAAVAIPAGADVIQADLRLEGGAATELRAGERVVEVIASGSSKLIVPGTRVDALVTRERGGTTLALENAEVITAHGLAADDGSATKVAAGLRVTVRQAVYLTAAQSFAREIRLLPRSPDDRGRSEQGLNVNADLG